MSIYFSKPMPMKEVHLRDSPNAVTHYSKPVFMNGVGVQYGSTFAPASTLLGSQHSFSSCSVTRAPRIQRQPLATFASTLRKKRKPPHRDDSDVLSAEAALGAQAPLVSASGFIQKFHAVVVARLVQLTYQLIQC